MVIWHGVRRARSLTITIASSVTIYKTPYKQDPLCGSLFHERRSRCDPGLMTAWWRWTLTSHRFSLCLSPVFHLFSSGFSRWRFLPLCTCHPLNIWFWFKLGCHHSKEETVSGCMESTKGVVSLLFIEAVVDVCAIWQGFSQIQEHDELFIPKTFWASTLKSGTVLHTEDTENSLPSNISWR